jgi:hypothetical protein
MSTDDIPVPLLVNFSHYENLDTKEKLLSTINASVEDVLKVDTRNTKEMLNEKQTDQQCEQNLEESIAVSGDTLHDEVQGQEEDSVKREEFSPELDSNKDNGTKQNAGIEDSNKTILLETKADHFDDNDNSGVQKGSTSLQGENVLQSSTVLSLDSYLKEHYGGDSQCKETINITAVPCATGAEVTSSETTNDPLQPCSDAPLFLVDNHGNFKANHGNERLLERHATQGDSKENSDNLPRYNRKNGLEVNKNALICHSEPLTPDEHLDGFVFVNKDGTARSNQGSPARLSPTHPQDTKCKNEDFDGYI